MTYEVEVDNSGYICINHYMYEVEVVCDQCKRTFERRAGQVNEAEKFGWKQFCSTRCQSIYKTKKVAKKCDNPSCHKVVTASPKAKNAYCSRNCSAKHGNLQRLKPFVLVKCANTKCSHFLRNHDSKYCSVECVNMSKKGITGYTEEKLLNMFQEFQKIHGRIPTKAELGHLNRPARNLFGSWNKAIKAAGLIPNEVIFSKKFTANDGHICDSLSEKIIDDWLSARKIHHDVHVKYPWNNGMSADFKVGEYWVEFFGLAGQLKRYDALKKDKIALIKKYKLKIVHLYLSDIFPINKLDTKLKSVTFIKRSIAKITRKS